MFEYSTISQIVGADGTAVTFNGASGIILTDVTGFDSPNIRTNVIDLPETDGAVAGSSYLGQRPITLTGTIASVDAATRNGIIVNLQRALRGLRANATLYGSPTGIAPMQIAVRVVNLRVTGQFVKQVQFQAIAPDPRMYSQAQHAATISQSGTPAAPGASFSWAFPINWGGGGGAYSCVLNVTNAGNFMTPPVLRAAGPISNPQFTDASSGLSLYVDGLTLASGEYIDVDMAGRTVTKNDGSNLYAKVRFPSSTWFQLDPGSSAIQLWGSATTAATALSVTWRDAWA